MCKYAPNILAHYLLRHLLQLQCILNNSSIHKALLWFHWDLAPIKSNCCCVFILCRMKIYSFYISYVIITKWVGCCSFSWSEEERNRLSFILAFSSCLENFVSHVFEMISLKGLHLFPIFDTNVLCPWELFQTSFITSDIVNTKKCLHVRSVQSYCLNV